MQSSAQLSVSHEVLELLASVLKFDPSQFNRHADLSLAEAGIDSLGLVEAVFVIEERLEIAIPFNANDQSRASVALMSVGQLLNQVVELVIQKRSDMNQMARA